MSKEVKGKEKHYATGFLAVDIVNGITPKEYKIGKHLKFGIKILQVGDKTDIRNEDKYIWLKDGISREKAEEVANNFLNEFLFTSPVEPFYPELRLIKYNMNMELKSDGRFAGTIIGIRFDFEFSIEENTDIEGLTKALSGDHYGENGYDDMRGFGVFSIITHPNVFPEIISIEQIPLEIVKGEI